MLCFWDLNLREGLDVTSVIQWVTGGRKRCLSCFFSHALKCHHHRGTSHEDDQIDCRLFVLDAYIIEEIKRQEEERRKKEEAERPRVYIEEPPPVEKHPDEIREEDAEDSEQDDEQPIRVPLRDPEIDDPNQDNHDGAMRFPLRNS